MRKSMKLFGAVVVVGLMMAPAFAGGNVHFALGNRELQGDYDTLDGQPFLGVQANFNVGDMPIDLTAAYYGSSKSETISGVDASVDVNELNFGVMKTWEATGNMRPFVGAGVGMVRVSVEIDTFFGSVSGDDTMAAAYGEGGIYWEMTNRFNLGFQGRLLKGSSGEIAGGSVDPDYFQIGVIAGFSFPGS